MTSSNGVLPEMNLRLVSILAATASLAAAAASAQSYGPPPGPPPGGQYGQDGYQAPQRSPQDIARQLRTRLQLRPDQEGALQAFVAAMAPPGDMQARMARQQEEASSMTTPERLDMMVSNMDAMRQVMLARVQATKAFYRQLTPDQQRAFDRMGAGSGGGMGGGMGPGGPG